MVGLGPRAREAAQEGFALTMKRGLRAKRGSTSSRGPVIGSASFGDDALFDRLRALRKRIADEIGRPPTSCSQTPLCAICARAQARRRRRDA